MMFYWVIHTLLQPVSFLLFPLKVVGRKNIPSKGGFILACNHMSYLDPVVVALASNRRMIGFVARDNLFRNLAFAWFIRSLGAFPIKRESADIGAVKESLKRLKSGKGILFFPEGTRLKAAGEEKVHPGVAMIAQKSGVPVVPVYVSGTEKVLPPKAKFFKRHRVTIRIGKPEVFSADKDYDVVARQILKNIYSLQP